jgi:hypothetical protein
MFIGGVAHARHPRIRDYPRGRHPPLTPVCRSVYGEQWQTFRHTVRTATRRELFFKLSTIAGFAFIKQRWQIL